MEITDPGLWGLFISAFISSTIAPGGSEAVLAYMVSEAKYPAIELVVVATVGNTLGALTTWGLGAFAAVKYPVDNLLPKKRLKEIETVRKWGSISLLFSWMPLIGDGFCFAAGWLKISFFASVLAIIAGKLVRYLFVAMVFS